MRGVRVLLVGALAAATVPLTAGAAFADRPAAGGFCEAAEEAAASDALSGDAFEDLDFSDPGALQDAYERAGDVVGELGQAAPKKLKSSFKAVSRFFDKLSDVDFSDPQEIEEAFIPSRKVTRAFEKITNYLADQCDINLGDDSNSEE